MPVFSLVEIAKLTGKILVFAFMLTILKNFSVEILDVIRTVITSMLPDSLNGLNLGFFANAIGLVDFLNTLLSSLYVAGGIFISGLISIIVFKYSIKAYTLLMGV